MNIASSDKQELQKDIDTANKLKPKLTEFLHNEQYKAAQKKARASKQRVDEMLSSDEIKIHTVKLAMRAFFDLQIWKKIPSPLEMAWTTGKDSNGHRLTAEELEYERNTDLSGFASFLLREYYDMKAFMNKTEYPNPLEEKNLEFFWSKFCQDLKILIQADKRRVALGNQGLVVTE